MSDRVSGSCPNAIQIMLGSRACRLRVLSLVAQRGSRHHPVAPELSGRQGFGPLQAKKKPSLPPSQGLISRTRFAFQLTSSRVGRIPGSSSKTAAIINQVDWALRAEASKGIVSVVGYSKRDIPIQHARPNKVPEESG